MMMLADRLPSNMMRSQWIPIEHLEDYREKLQAELDRATRAPGWNPKIVKLDGDRIAIDVCSHSRSDEIHSAHVAVYVDHPFLKELPSNAPRAVKALYRKEVRIKHLRADEYWPLHFDIKAARDAWAKYRIASGK